MIPVIPPEQKTFENPDLGRVWYELNRLANMSDPPIQGIPGDPGSFENPDLGKIWYELARISGSSGGGSDLIVTGEINFSDFPGLAVPNEIIPIGLIPIGYVPDYMEIQNEISWLIPLPSPMYLANITLFFGNGNGFIGQYLELKDPITNFSNHYYSGMSNAIPNNYDRSTPNQILASLTLQGATINQLISGKLKYKIKFIKL